MHGPDPDCLYPFNGEPHTVFLKNAISRPNIFVGDYTYYHDDDGAAGFQDRCVRYHFEFLGDRLIIGRFTAIAMGAQFIMNGANHAMTGLSAYPFNIFGQGWDEGFDFATIDAGLRGDTTIGNDVWIGREATIMPGITIGDGAIVGTRAVVASDIPPYAIAVGNPARVIRRRFDNKTIDRLLAIAWWNWPAEQIGRHLDRIRGADIDALERAATSLPSAQGASQSPASPE
ncbi:CatB-related O-acetyltransferase [Breoghania sp. JC706]|uniref:CatB-related O-acetyltransferase n=1 Tax=Breoghania sp. JC706 TaxID=3117732 RepID=UPI003009CA89